MAFSLIAFISPNYRDNKNEWLKAYEPGTTTPKVMALDSGGVTQVAKLQLNSDGFLVSAGNALVIPYIDGAYDLWLFPTEPEADANDTSNAIRLADNVIGPGSTLINSLSQTYEFTTVADYKASAIEFPDGKTIRLLDRGTLFTKVTGTGGANGFNLISSTSVNQSIDLIEQKDVSFRMLGAFDAGVTYAIDSMQFTVDNYTSITAGEGDYKWDKSLVMRSGVTVTCHENAVMDAEDLDNTLYPRAIEFLGVIGSENNLLTALDRDETSIHTDGGYGVGDLIYVVSVRNSLSSIDSGEWWLGGGTASSRYAYFAEFNLINSVDGGDVYGMANSTIFPFYAINNSGETESLRTRTTTQLVTPIKDAHWVGGQIKRTTSGNDIVYMLAAQDCSVVDTVLEKGARLGNSFYIAKSYNCFGFNIKNINDPTLVWDYNILHGKMNRFKVVGAQGCGFTGLSESYGAQSIDFSYSASEGQPTCNIRPYVKQSNFEHCFEGLTTHAGSFQSAFINNDIYNCVDDGIFDRSYQSVIQGNRIYATQETDDGLPPVTPYNPSYGVVVGYGGRDANVSSNTIRGFQGAFQIKSSTTSNWQYTDMLSSFTNNEISQCFVGLYVSGNGSENNAERKVNYSQNRHIDMGRFIVQLEDYNQGFTIKDNVLEGDFTYDGLGSYVAFVDTEVDCPNLKILGNVWNRTKGGNSGYNVFMTSIGSVSDLTEFPEADFAGLTKVQGNVVAHEDSDGVISSVGTNNYIQVATEVNETIVKNISGSAITTVSAVSRVTFISVGTTGLENLDQILPVDNAPWRKGDIVYLNQDSSSDDYTLRDIGTSGASTYGFQTPGGTSISSTTNNHVIQCMYVGPHWLVVSSQTDA